MTFLIVEVKDVTVAGLSSMKKTYFSFNFGLDYLRENVPVEFNGCWLLIPGLIFADKGENTNFVKKNFLKPTKFNALEN